MAVKGQKNNPRVCDICKRRMSKERYEVTHICPSCEEKQEIKKLDTRENYHFEVIEGITIKVRNKQEEIFLRNIAKDYTEIDFEIPDPNALLSILLSMRLEVQRTTDMLANPKIEHSDKRDLHNSLKNLSDEIKKIQDKLEITRQKMQAKEKTAIEILKEQHKESRHFFATNKGHRTGVGICTKCEERIIFSGNFETLEIELAEDIKDIIDYTRRDLEPDSCLLEEEKKKFRSKLKEVEKEYSDLSKDAVNILARLFYLLEVRKIPKAYTEYHRRQIEKALS